MNLADVNVPSKFTESGVNLSGDKTLSKRIITNMTKGRQRAEKTIFALAKKDNVSVDEVVHKILTNSKSIAQLQRYVLSKGEKPNADPTLLAAQATLIRTDELATVAKALDTTDEDALLQIETAEQDAVDSNSPDLINFLSNDVQAALKLGMDHIKSVAGNLKTFIAKVKSKSKFDGFDLNTETLLFSPTGGKIGSASPQSYRKQPYDPIPNNFDFSYVDPNSGLSYLQANETTPATSSGGGFFSIFDKIVSGINSVTSGITSAVGTTKSSINDLFGSVSNQASNVGADSITKAMSNYIPYIIAGVIAIVLVIVIAIYASKNK